jgi:hypothetical protein
MIKSPIYLNSAFLLFFILLFWRCTDCSENITTVKRVKKHGHYTLNAGSECISIAGSCRDSLLSLTYLEKNRAILDSVVLSSIQFHIDDSVGYRRALYFFSETKCVKSRENAWDDGKDLHYWCEDDYLFFGLLKRIDKNNYLISYESKSPFEIQKIYTVNRDSLFGTE